MSNHKVQKTQNLYVSKHSEPYKTDPMRIFSEDQIRTRAYQIYESGNRNSNYPERIGARPRLS